MPERNVWFTSDTHFGHESIIYYADRPFEGPEDMDECLIDKWNEKVKPEDTVYHLGDFSICPKHAKAIRPKLNGKIKLIVGNHDPITKYSSSGLFQGMFESYKLGSISKITKDCVATHRPTLVSGSLFNIHGHIHNRLRPTPKHLNICVEQTEYEPINLEELMELSLTQRQEE